MRRLAIDARKHAWTLLVAFLVSGALIGAARAQSSDLEPPAMPTLPIILELPEQIGSQTSGGLASDLSHGLLLPISTPIYRGFATGENAEFKRLMTAWLADQQKFNETSRKTLNAFYEARLHLLEPGDLVPESGYPGLSAEDNAYLNETRTRINNVAKHREEVAAAITEFESIIRFESDKRTCAASEIACYISPFDVAGELPLPEGLRVLLSKRFVPMAPADLSDDTLTAKIVAMIVEDKVFAARLQQAEADLDDVSFRYNVAFEAEAEAKKRFGAALVTHTETTGPLQATRSEIKEKIAELQRKQAGPVRDQTDFEKSATYQNLQSAIAREIAVIERLEGRREQVREFGGSEQTAQSALQALQAATDAARSRLDTLNSELAERKAAAADKELPPPAFSPEVNALRIELEQVEREIRKADAALDASADTLFEAFEKLGETDEKLAEAMEVVDGLKGKGLKPLLSIETNGIFRATFTNKRAEMQDLNQAISLAREAVFEAKYHREKLRHEMLEANDETSIASEQLQDAIMDSARGQLLVEAYQQAKSGVDAAKGGPAVFLAWAATQTATNIFNPPKIYEPEYRLDGGQSTAIQMAKSFVTKDKQETAARAAKYGRDKVLDHMKTVTNDTLKRRHIESEMQKILALKTANSSGDYLNTRALAALQTRYKAQRAAYEEISEALRSRMFASGKSKFATKVSVDLLKSLGKSLFTEALKREIADFFEGHAWRNYMYANNRFVTAVRGFRIAGTIYWQNMDAYEGLLALRKAIKSKYFDPKSSLIIDHSDEFDVREEERFWLNFADENGDPSTQPHLGNVRVFLNAVELHRYPNSNIFDMLRSDAEKLRRAGQRELTMKIVFE